MSMPICDYRFGNLEYVTSFVTPHNPDIEDVVAGFRDVVGDDFVKAVANFIGDGFEYPLDNGGNPSTDGQMLRYHKAIFPPNYQWKDCRFYVWAYPSEVLQSKLGYCAETANLALSLLLNKIHGREISAAPSATNACVALGDVKSSKDNTLLGRHAWIEVPHKGESYVLETTIHPAANNLATTKGVYNAASDWAQQGGLYYVPRARYNDVVFEGETDIVTMMGLPAKRVLLFGLPETQKMRAAKAKVLYKEFKKETAIMNELLKSAWGG